MTKGWEYLEPLETARPSEELDAEAVVAACDKLNELNRDLRCRIENALRDKGFNKWADGLRNEFLASDERLFNCYFGNKAYSFEIPSQPPDHLGRLSCCGRLPHERRPPADADTPLACATKGGCPERMQFHRARRVHPRVPVHEHACARQRDQKRSVRDVEDFAFGAEDLLVGTDGSRYSCRVGKLVAYDADFMGEQVLLGFMRASSPSLLNSNYTGSPIVAAGLVRSHLEAVLFRKDLTASLEGQEPLSADAWYAALRLHRDAGHVTPALNQWVTQLYGLLSRALHSGVTLSRGEVWAFRRVVDLLRDSLNDQQ